jgi:hypothetical protein
VGVSPPSQPDANESRQLQHAHDQNLTRLAHTSRSISILIVSEIAFVDVPTKQFLVYVKKPSTVFPDDCHP